MFDWLDWGHSMEITTNELAGVNPFMGYAGSASGDPMQPKEAGWLLQALLLSAVMLILGGVIWRDRLRKKDRLC